MSSFPIRSFIIILICTISGVLLGSLVGLLMGSTAPDFGPALLGLGRSKDEYPFNGRQIGIGLGIGNGVWVGLLAGIAIVVAEAIKSLKKP